jgi:hypothetical protein
MNITGKTIWQVAAGDGQKHYANQCLCHNVVIMGPGAQGPWPDCEPRLLSSGWSPQKMAILRTFCGAMKAGDIVVLHVGAVVWGVGEVRGPYVWNPRFDKVQGWDLQHTQPVLWLWKGYEAPKVFPPKTLGFGATVKALKSSAVLDWLESLEPNGADG